MYSGALISALSNSKRDWSLISFTIHSLNTLLTSKYTIPISSELYKERTRLQQTRKCQHCYMKKFKTIIDDEGNESKEYFESPTEIPDDEVIPFKEFIYGDELILGGEKFRIIWICSKCSNVNKISDTPVSDKKYRSNATFGVMYDQPIRTFTNRSMFDILSMNWITDFLREIDMGLMAFQREYFEQHGTGMKDEMSSISHEMR